MKRSSTSGPTFVTPQAIRALWPRITAGTPGKLTPSTSYGQADETPRQRRPFMYQMLGIWIPRCGSLARSAWPVALLDGATTQSLEPTPGWPNAVSEVPKPASAPIPDAIAPRRRSPVAPAEVTDANAAAGVAPARDAPAGWVASVAGPTAVAGPTTVAGGSFEPAPYEPAAPVGTITGPSVPSAGASASVNAGLPSRASLRTRKISASRFPPRLHACTFPKTTESTGSHGSGV